VKKRVKKSKRSSYRSPKTKYSIKSILIQSLSVLLISIIGESFTGTVLIGMRAKISIIPGLLIIVPALTDLRGNVGAAFGERLSTMLHLGILKPKFRFSKIVQHNIFASFTLTFTIAFVIGMIAPLFSKIFHINSSSPLILSFISITAGVTSSIILLPFVFIMVFYAFNHHIDPDNIIAPLLPVVGDIVTVSAIYFAAVLILKISGKTLVLPTFLLLAFLFSKGHKFKNSKKQYFPDRYHYIPIIKQSLPVLLICLSIGIGSGIFLQGADKTFEIFPLLLSLVPQVIAQGGSIGGIVGSRVSTSLYLGNAKPFKFGKEVIKNLTAGIIMGTVTGPIIAIISFLTAVITKTPLIPFYKVMIISSAALFLLSLLMGIIAVYVAFFSFKIHLDPSNVVIPIITSIGDISGVVILISIIKIVLL
jgi:mgtE-like transporter